MNNINNKIICLMGPTGLGKTEIALKIAKTLPCDIISVDSAMVYRGLDIGTSKPDIKILKTVPHALIDIREPTEPYSAGDFRIDAIHAIERSLKNHRMPLLVGGTLLYFKALQEGLSILPKANFNFRNYLNTQVNVLGLEKLYNLLKKIDYLAAEKIDPHDQQRIQRALEVYFLTGYKITDLQDLKNNNINNNKYKFLHLVISPKDKLTLKSKITERFYLMLKQGFLEEVINLTTNYQLHQNLSSMRTIGYRQIYNYLLNKNKIDFDEMVKQAIYATEQLAKRQLTWLRRWPLENRSNFIVDLADAQCLDKIYTQICEAILNL